ncbi:unnamed protein product [Zymoseptoria tritici ST99CH_1A5]|uniref:Uncharacterized protein n=2 Tax=Zymoseptoria tritici TaxID=1047171 RepID=A0A2H1H8T5_ZYMTR|nr:unnamed protein product [Zymoseptoria tritici ST99CH_1E4]SMY30063.1 unnamed protein product [Zymoseptoria tritici ST99CH_1A5]
MRCTCGLEHCDPTSTAPTIRADFPHQYDHVEESDTTFLQSSVIRSRSKKSAAQSWTVQCRSTLCGPTHRDQPIERLFKTTDPPSPAFHPSSVPEGLRGRTWISDPLAFDKG